jgi:hypothetical protein
VLADGAPRVARLSLQAARHRATLAALIEHHEGAAAKLMEGQTKGAA